MRRTACRQEPAWLTSPRLVMKRSLIVAVSQDRKGILIQLLNGKSQASIPKDAALVLAEEIKRLLSP